METNTTSAINWRTLGFSIGIALIAVGGQPLVTYLSGDTSMRSLVPSLITTIVGFGILALSKFYNPKPENKLFQRIEALATSPVPYALLILLIWIYFETLAVQRNIELSTLRNDEQAMAKVIDRLVMPRHLSKDQQRMISNFLQQFEPHEFAFKLLPSDEEAGSYRVDIEQALIKGGWTRAVPNAYIYTNDIPEGLSINFTQTMEHGQKQGDWHNPNASLTLQEAFGLAGVHINQVGSASGIGVTQDRLEITVGRPRRDSYVLTLPD